MIARQPTLWTSSMTTSTSSSNSPADLDLAASLLFQMPLFANFALQPNFGMQLNAQLCMMVNEKLDLLKQNAEVVVEKTSDNYQKSTLFSIESLLRVKEETDERDEQASSCSTSTSSEAAGVYTLDALEDCDGRAKKSKKLTSESDRSRCVCDQCGKSYATTSNLSRHKQTHRSLEGPHAKQCPHCERVYVSMPALSMHILTHKATHECNVCGKRFSRLWLLQGHLRSHTGQRPFGCAHCGKNFADRSNLRAHILTHTGDKKYKCEKCSRRFALRAYLNRHLESSCSRIT